MSTSTAPSTSLQLPERAVLLHIGLMKTGTTSLQNAAAALRPELLAQGVRYPGTTVNHRSAVNDFMGHSWGWDTTPVHGAWSRLRAEIDRDAGNRIWVGHEFGANADDATALRWRAELGERAHVVVTLRNYASILPSLWQQMTKEGERAGFEQWLRGVLSDDPADELRSFRDRIDQGRVVTRWAEAFGPQNVTVVVVDKSTPELLFDAFESMLGLEPGLLSTAKLDGKASNRGMSLEEAELLRLLNHKLRKQLAWLEYCKWLRDSASTSVLRYRRTGDHDTKLVLPTWAAQVAQERAATHVEQIVASGVRVVGDLEHLRAEVRSAEDPPMRSAVVPIDAAVEAILGVIRQGRREEDRLATAREEIAALEADARARRKTGPALSEASGRELVRALGSRVKRRLRRG
ncbi:hypothetical protein [Krasilnikoviella flava]|uniref:Sulfotransferase family protein n=1 Tax=Krasilnikoviella flava TaxID=526729 RepID=A0A1T5IAK3_9MICO|nr:hypothetical protein [Krasilnikoviella flava]SKC36110.1 hypothetical protein SAMN04324258_0238 [Krasilnikoviella flava]